MLLQKPEIGKKRENKEKPKITFDQDDFLKFNLLRSTELKEIEHFSQFFQRKRNLRDFGPLDEKDVEFELEDPDEFQKS